MNNSAVETIKLVKDSLPKYDKKDDFTMFLVSKGFIKHSEDLYVKKVPQQLQQQVPQQWTQVADHMAHAFSNVQEWAKKAWDHVATLEKETLDSKFGQKIQIVNTSNDVVIHFTTIN